MGILPIRIYPDPVLRVTCPPVERFDDELRQLAADMVVTMHAAPGIGLAAPQVGVELRLAVVDLSGGENPEELLTLVNPAIRRSHGSQTDIEGCLSLPGITEKITRPARVWVEAQDLDGESFQLEADELLARALCHEIDHLDGVLFIDYLTGLKKERMRRQIKRLARAPEAVTA